MKLSNELLNTLKMVLNDRRDEANRKLYDAYATCVLYQHFETHTQYIKKCVRELDSIQKQLDEIAAYEKLYDVENETNDEVAEQYNRFHESDE